MMKITPARRTSRRMISTLASVVLLSGMLALAPMANAGRAGCSVTNSSTGKVYSGLARAIKTAIGGDTLSVTGRCIGVFTIDKDLTLRGNSTTTYPNPTIDGNGNGAVLYVGVGGHVAITDLVITGGKSGSGGGILNDGGTVDLYGSSLVIGNTSTGVGGGILNNSGTVTMNGTSSVELNTSTDGGGIFNIGGGTVTLNGTSSVSGNEAVVGSGFASGGGIWNSDQSTVTLNDSSSVSGNKAQVGGGIANSGAVNLNGSSSVSGNTAYDLGGGIFNDYGSTVSPNCNAVTGNIGGDCVAAP